MSLHMLSPEVTHPTHHHALRTASNPYANRGLVTSCDVCKRQPIDPSYHCDACQYDLCQACFDSAPAEASAFKHPDHPHPLSWRTDVYKARGLVVACDVCSNVGFSSAYHCDACGFDVCLNCQKQGNRFFVRPVPRNERIGLFTSSGIPLPIRDVSANINLMQYSAQVVLKQTYVNMEDSPLEVTYSFPLDRNAAVHSFDVSISGRHVVGKVMPKKKADERYEDTIASGGGAYMAEQTREDLLTANIGNLPPGQTAEVTIRYVTELTTVPSTRDTVKFVLPTFMAPGYAQRIQQGKSVGTLDLTLEAQAAMTTPIMEVTSPSHRIASTIDGATAVIRVENDRTFMLDKDFVLQFKLASNPVVHALVQEDPTPIDASRKYSIMIPIVPNFEDSWAVDMDEPDTECIFVVDCSGSMSGKPIEECSRTLKLFLQSLPPTAHFNVVRFGSSFQKLFPSGSQKKTPATLEKGLRYVTDLKADLGGTELYHPLSDLFSSPLLAGLPRQVFVLTDGEVSSPDTVISLVRKNMSTCRVFTFGIGNSVSHKLVEGMAEAGGGQAEFIKEGEPIDAKVLGQLGHALQPAFTNLSITLGDQVKLATAALPPVFYNSCKVVYAFASEVPADLSAMGLQFKATVKKDMDITIPIPAARMPLPVGHDASKARPPIHYLAAKSRIKELEGKESMTEGDKKEVETLGVEFQLLSSQTNFLAVEERVDPTTGAMVTRDIGSMQPQHRPSSAPMMPSFGFGAGAVANSYSPPMPRAMAGSGLYGSSNFGFGGAPTMMAPGSSPRSFGSQMMPSFGPFGSSGSARKGAPSLCSAPTRSPPKEREREKRAMPMPCDFYKVRQAMPTMRRERDDSEDECCSRKRPSPPPRPVVPTASPLDSVLMSQEFEGGWKLRPSLAAAIGVSIDDLSRAIPTGGNPDAWATAVVLAWLELKHKGAEATWSIIAKRGLKVLNKAGLAALIEEARRFLAGRC